LVKGKGSIDEEIISSFLFMYIWPPYLSGVRVKIY
jgi:hypothetical protein